MICLHNMSAQDLRNGKYGSLWTWLNRKKAVLVGSKHQVDVRSQLSQTLQQYLALTHQLLFLSTTSFSKKMEVWWTYKIASWWQMWIRRKISKPWSTPNQVMGHQSLPLCPLLFEDRRLLTKLENLSLYSSWYL